MAGIDPSRHGLVVPVGHDQRQRETAQHPLRRPGPLLLVLAHADELARVRQVVLAQLEIGQQPFAQFQLGQRDAGSSPPQADQFVADLSGGGVEAVLLDRQPRFAGLGLGGLRVETSLLFLGLPAHSLEAVDLAHRLQAGLGQGLFERAVPLGSAVAVIGMPFQRLLQTPQPTSGVPGPGVAQALFSGSQLGQRLGEPVVEGTLSLDVRCAAGAVGAEQIAT